MPPLILRIAIREPNWKLVKARAVWITGRSTTMLWPYQ